MSHGHQHLNISPGLTFTGVKKSYRYFTSLQFKNIICMTSLTPSFLLNTDGTGKLEIYRVVHLHVSKPLTADGKG